MVVMKFGGTSVRDAEALREVATIVLDQSARSSGTVVVLSATSGTTNALLSLARLAASGRSYDDAFAELEQRHRTIARDLGIPSVATTETFLAECKEHLEAAAILGECTPQTLDAIAGYGELLSTTLFVAYMTSIGADVQWVDARKVIVTNELFQSASVQIDSTVRATKAIITPMTESGAIVVTQGFIGATADGIPTTLGRGGSDYSAALLGRCLNASEIQIWTDVSGVYTCDPRIVPDAEPLESISFDDVRTMALYGAKVLHPETVEPAVAAGIPVRVLNTFESSARGTTITASQETKRAITALSVLAPCIRIHTNADGARSITSVEQLRSHVALDIATKNGHTVIVHAPSDAIMTAVNVAAVGHEHTATSVACIALCGNEVTATASVARIAEQLRGVPETTIASLLEPRCVIVSVPIASSSSACIALHQLVSSTSSSAS